MTSISINDRYVCSDCADYNEIKDFHKVLDFKDRLVMYIHKNLGKNVQKKNVASAVTAGDVFIIHNKQDVQLKRADLILALENNQISCPRCRNVIQHALKLMRDLPTLNTKDIMGVCAHCRKNLQIQKTCDKCEEVVKKFIAARDKKNEDYKKRDNMWLSKVDLLVNDLSTSYNDELITKHTTYTRFHTDRISDFNEIPVQTKEERFSDINIKVTIDKKPIIVLHPNKIFANHSSDESMITIPRTIQEDEGFIYYFPKRKDKEQHQPKSENSAELIRATRERLKANEEEYKIFLKEINKTLLGSDHRIISTDKIRYGETTTTPFSTLSPITNKTRREYSENDEINIKSDAIGEEKDEIDTEKNRTSADINERSKRGEINKKHRSKGIDDLPPSEEKHGKEIRNLPSDKEKRDMPFDKETNILRPSKAKAEFTSGIEKRDLIFNKGKHDLPSGKEKRDLPFDKEKLDLPFEKEKRDLPPEKEKRDLPPGNEMRDSPSGKEKLDFPSGKEKRDLISDKEKRDLSSGKDKSDLLSDNGTHKTGDFSSSKNEDSFSTLKKKDKVTGKGNDLLPSMRDDIELSKKHGTILPKEKGDLAHATKPLNININAEKSNLYDKKSQEKDKILKQKNGPKEIDMKKIKVKKTSALILQLMKKSKEKKRNEPIPKIGSAIFRALESRKKTKISITVENADQMIETSESEDVQPNIEVSKLIRGEKIVKYKHPRVQKTSEYNLLHNSNEESEIEQNESIMMIVPHPSEYDEENVGIMRYALSDRTFIDKGWTMLPTEKIMRRMNVFRMRPAYPEFDWFERHKNKQPIKYDTGEILSMVDENGRGRWYYRNGRLALDYYDAEEMNAGHRFVVYSSGEPDERGRTYPITVLATFDYLGNGVVFDHSGKIRLKYNQTEGVVLDRSIGPVSHWKWHALNDPPVLKQVMIDTETAYKDPNIVKLGPSSASVVRHDEEMLTIELENFAKEKIKKINQDYRPFQIKMKALKINEHFSLKVLDQSKIYLIFRDGSTNLKLNLGMLLDHHEILDTDAAELGEVHNNLERAPRSGSLAGLREVVNHAQCVARMKTERNKKLHVPVCSADKLIRAVSRPMQHPLMTISAAEICHYNRKPSTNNFYYNTRII